MEITDKAVDFVHDTGDKVADKSYKMGRVLRKKAKKLKKIEQRLMKSSSTYVSENPVASIGMALAAGFLISRVFSL